MPTMTRSALTIHAPTCARVSCRRRDGARRGARKLACFFGSLERCEDRKAMAIKLRRRSRRQIPFGGSVASAPRRHALVVPAPRAGAAASDATPGGRDALRGRRTRSGRCCAASGRKDQPWQEGLPTAARTALQRRSSCTWQAPRSAASGSPRGWCWPRQTARGADGIVDARVRRGRRQKRGRHNRTHRGRARLRQRPRKHAPRGSRSCARQHEACAVRHGGPLRHGKRAIRAREQPRVRSNG